ncbi:Glycosyltransferase family 64 protein C4 [Cercospora zeina]
MVLTKAAFYHTDWMKAYWADDAVTTSLREYVEKQDNCEDILMSFLHAHFARIPPIFVKPEVMVDFGGSDGVSSRKGHLQYRLACVQRFNEAFGEGTLVPNDMVFQRVRPELWDQWG